MRIRNRNIPSVAQYSICVYDFFFIFLFLNSLWKMAVDLTEVKKIIISLANLNPKGIFADQLNTDYQKREGMQIPFDQFGYSSLLVFLQHELQQNQQIKMVDEGFGSYVIYPIANARSGHVLEFTKNQLTAETKKKQYGRVTTSTQLRYAFSNSHS